MKIQKILGFVHDTNTQQNKMGEFDALIQGTPPTVRLILEWHTDEGGSEQPGKLLDLPDATLCEQDGNLLLQEPIQQAWIDAALKNDSSDKAK